MNKIGAEVDSASPVVIARIVRAKRANLRGPGSVAPPPQLELLLTVLLSHHKLRHTSQSTVHPVVMYVHSGGDREGGNVCCCRSMALRPIPDKVYHQLLHIALYSQEAESSAVLYCAVVPFVESPGLDDGEP
jgi:hypothetical protein